MSYLFVHTPKCAGKFIKKSLNLSGVDFVNHSHSTLSDSLKRNNSNDIKVMACVREPIDRFVSIYRYFINGGTARNLGELNLYEFLQTHFLNINDLVDFIYENKIYPKLHFYPQTYFLDGEVDVFIDFKNLKNDLVSIIESNKMQAKFPKSKNSFSENKGKIDLLYSKFNLENNFGLQTPVFELNAASIEKLGEIYKEDFELYSRAI